MLPEDFHDSSRFTADPGADSFSRRIGARILVVDDDADMRNLVRRVLRDGNRVIGEAADGSAGFDATLGGASVGSPYHPVLLNYKMPYVDGLEVLERMRGRGATAKIPVLFYTACGGIDMLLRAYAAGAIVVLSVPFELAVLTRHVDMLLRRAV